MKPLISVIIPTYNRGHLIAETIESVMAQTYSNFEVIVIDDGSTDNTAGIVKSIQDKRLKYFFQPNSGLPAISRNTGVGFSNGEYLAFLDSDDLWLAQKIEKQLSFFEKDPNLALVSTNAFYILDDKKTGMPLVKGLKSKYFNDREFLPEIKVVQSSVLMKKSVFLQMGGYNEDPDLKAREDGDLWLRIYPKYPCYYLNECLVYYRKDDSSISGDELNYIKTSLKHYNKYFASYGFSEKINNKKISGILHHLACLQFLADDKQYLENAKRAYQFKKNRSNLILYLFFLLLPRRFTIKLYQLRNWLIRKHKLKEL